MNGRGLTLHNTETERFIEEEEILDRGTALYSWPFFNNPVSSVYMLVISFSTYPIEEKVTGTVLLLYWLGLISKFRTTESSVHILYSM